MKKSEDLTYLMPSTLIDNYCPVHSGVQLNPDGTPIETPLDPNAPTVPVSPEDMSTPAEITTIIAPDGTIISSPAETTTSNPPTTAQSPVETTIIIPVETPTTSIDPANEYHENNIIDPNSPDYGPWNN